MCINILYASTPLGVGKMSLLLNNLYIKYRINLLSHGALADALGDVYEEFVEEIFKDLPTINSWPIGSLEHLIVSNLSTYLSAYLPYIQAVSSSRKGIPLTVNGGSPKTDVYLNITLQDGQIILVPLNLKQSTVSKVSFAEYDVATIINDLSITDPNLIFLLEKHQTDASAKNFTPSERLYLRTHLAPHVRNLVRWCITLNSQPTYQNISYPEYVIRFDLHHPQNNNPLGNQFKAVNVYDIEEYIDKIMLTLKGKPRSGGFGTGLSWTYATGSKGKKIQFKG